MAELHEIQNLVAKIRRERGFTMDPVRIFALLAEEVGEIASELKKVSDNLTLCRLNN
jgi:NTP pyrophosphatase (non-canonical NTP hydrolase)